MINTYNLYKKGQWVGEAVIFTSGTASYHLWENIRKPAYSTKFELEKKYELRIK